MMYRKRKLLILILVGFVILLASCDGNILGKQPTTIGDPRLNGTFTYFYTWKDSLGIEEIYEYTSYTFNGTNKVSFYTKFYSYSKTTGWSYSGDYIGDHYSFEYEFEVSGGMYRHKLWDNRYSSWYDWEPYSFSADGKTLTLYNTLNINGLNEVLTKK